MTTGRLVLVIAVATLSVATMADEGSSRCGRAERAVAAAQSTAILAMPAGMARSIHQRGG